MPGPITAHLASKLDYNSKENCSVGSTSDYVINTHVVVQLTRLTNYPYSLYGSFSFSLDWQYLQRTWRDETKVAAMNLVNFG